MALFGTAKRLLLIIASIIILWSVSFFINNGLRLNIPPANIFSQDSTGSVQEGETSLPYFKLLRPTASLEIPLISGAISVPTTSSGSLEYLYIPYYSGNLLVSLNGEPIFTSVDKLGITPVNAYRSALIPLRNLKANEENLAEVTLRKSTRIFASLAKIYIGPKPYFVRAVLIREIITKKVPIILWGLTLLALLSLVFVSCTTRNVSETLPVIVITLFIFCGISANIFAEYYSIGSMTKYVLIFSPLLVVATHNFLTVILLKAEGSKKSIWITASAVSLIILSICILFPSLTHVMNLLVSAPVMVIGILFTAIHSFLSFIRFGNYAMLLFGVSLTAIAFALSYDILLRFGFFQESVFLLSLALTIFFMNVVLIFTNEVFQMRNELAQQELLLAEKLAERELELNIENSKNLSLIETSAVLKENARLARDLHDGVLTYLSVIQALSEKREDTNDKIISKISKYASQEIRFILDTGADQYQDTFVMLSIFRQQVVEPMMVQGLSIEWDMLNLMDKNILPASSSLNLFRILQEAFHNAHARAGCARIRVGSEVDERNVLKIFIENTGGSTFNPADKYGYGINNMKRRAHLIGATFDIVPIYSGAKVLITFSPHDRGVS
ncbi:hypothetical protein [Marivita sp. XM-24bin2]|uniref:sensor histidine kinase n=1 Tax=Marivita sp. XM-24bin2 TaxID=2133951 RepID=UPI0025BF4E0F|nr:hypothetical protein [Marivita sp. XM-24bin2]